MNRLINGAIYQVNLNGKSKSEFSGEHPSIVVKTVSERDLYYIIPLTTFTKERWEKYKKDFGCRIHSTESIAIISKMQVRHVDNIKARSVSKNFTPPKILVPTSEELSNVLKKLNTYLAKATARSLSAYNDFMSERFEFLETAKYLSLVNYNNFKENSSFVIFKQTEEYITLKLDGLLVKHMSVKDVLSVLQEYIPEKFSINYYKDGDYYLISIQKPIVN